VTAELEPIRAALKNGDKATARQLLPPLLKAQPTADLWTLAALACEQKQDGIKCLRKALALDPLHTQANRLLFKWEGAKPPSADEWQRLTGDNTAPLPEKITAKPLPLKKVRHKGKRSPWRWVGILSFLLLGSACSLFTLNMAGVINGVFTRATVFLGGPTPVSQWNGQALANVDNAAEVIPASQSEQIGEIRGADDPAVRTSTGGRDADVLDPGYSHQYTFEAQAGDQYGIYVQFLSVGAARVSRNVAVLRPDGSSATETCEHESILQGDNNVAYICDIHSSGTWSVRILGREGESVGAYFVGIEQIQGA
jgi:hypothetical protein